MARRAKGTPTDLNVWVLGKVAEGRRKFPNGIAAVDMPHLRRCMHAGLVEIVDRMTLRLTDRGVDLVNAHPRTKLKVPRG